jgi:hypothetical protein
MAEIALMMLESGFVGVGVGVVGGVIDIMLVILPIGASLPVIPLAGPLDAIVSLLNCIASFGVRLPGGSASI